jgi:hypothetical protein
MSRTVSAAKMEAIVNTILDELGGVPGRDLLSSRDETGAKVADALKNWIGHFQRWSFWHGREGRKILADHAEKLAELIAALECELDALTEPLAAFLFKPTAARRAVLPEDLLMAAIESERQALAERLKQMRLACQAQKPPPPRLEPDRVKDLCAAFAFDLMRAFSRRRSHARHLAIASLIYEALTGEVEAELKRSCDRVRARARTFRLRDRAPPT